MPTTSFPAVFPLKVMGRNTPEFTDLVRVVMEKHVPGLDASAFVQRLSRGDNYLAITVTFHAHSREQVEAIYQELHSSGQVLMSL